MQIFIKAIVLFKDRPGCFEKNDCRFENSKLEIEEHMGFLLHSHINAGGID